MNDKHRREFDDAGGQREHISKNEMIEFNEDGKPMLKGTPGVQWLAKALVVLLTLAAVAMAAYLVVAYLLA